MIRWRFPYSAPRDGTKFVAKKLNGVLQNCWFDEEGPWFVIEDLVDVVEPRTTPTLTDHVGWAPWDILFQHVQDTGGDLDRQELKAARRDALSAVDTLYWLKCLSASSFDKKALEEVESAIQRLLKIVPEGQ